MAPHTLTADEMMHRVLYALIGSFKSKSWREGSGEDELSRKKQQKGCRAGDAISAT